jgi:hypothetical protein
MKLELGAVVNACNPSYLGAESQENLNSRADGQKLTRPHLK